MHNMRSSLLCSYTHLMFYKMINAQTPMTNFGNWDLELDWKLGFGIYHIVYAYWF